MALRGFPYREFDIFRSLETGTVPVMRPMLATSLSLGDQRWKTSALVDTGAPFTLFNHTAGVALGVDFHDPNAKREKHRLGGATHLAQYQEVTLAVSPFDDLVWKAEVGFIVTAREMPFGGLLGQTGFLDHWAVSFDYPKSFVIESKATFEGRLPEITQEDITAIWEWQELGWRGPPDRT